MKKIYTLFLFISLFSVVKAQVAFTSSDLPVVTINTYGKTILDEPKITAYMRIIYNGQGKRNYVTDSANVYSGAIGIELRGQSSLQFPKKPYGIETRDAQGNDLDVAIFGWPAESDWVLYPSYSDKTLLRNAVAFKLYEGFGRYSVRTKHCEVILNGDYVGVYVFMEKIKRDKGRVNIKKLEPADVSGDALTGGYIVKIDKKDIGTSQGWTSAYPPPDNSSRRITYLYTYPKEEDITSEQKTYIKSVFDNFEKVMNSTSYTDPFSGYYDLINLQSFVDTYLLFELVKNVDSYRLSTYFYKDRNSVSSKICYGPVWDLDFGFGNADYDNGAYAVGWEVFINNTGSEWLTPFWNRKLINDPVFYNAMAKRWFEVKNSLYSMNNISALIDSTANTIIEGRNRNFQRWKILGKYVWPNAYVGATYEDEIKYLKSWIQSRLNWLTTMFPETYTDITWLTPESSLLNIKTGEKSKIALSKMFQINKNADSVQFVSSGGNIVLTKEKDSLVITAFAPGSYKIKGKAFRNNSVYDISPEYTLTSTGVIGVLTESELPSDFSVSQNYPNPFNPETHFSYSISKSSYLSIKVYDILGKEITTLWEGVKSPGTYSIKFNAAGLQGGVYFCRVKTAEASRNIKMVYLK